MNTIKVIAFDADDTLWANESYFQEIEEEFTSLLSVYMPEKEVSEELFQTEMKNLHLYGFGIKSFVLSMIETALRISDDEIEPLVINQILNLGKKLKKFFILLHPIINWL